MDNFDLTRLLLLDALFSASIRYRIIAESAQNTALARLLNKLSAERANLADLALDTIVDVTVRKDWELNPGPGDLEIVTQAAELAIANGLSSMVQCAMEAELGIAEILEDIPPDLLPRDLREAFGRASQVAIHDLNAVMLTLRAPNDILEFRTKGSRTGKALRPAYEVWFGTNRKPVLRDGATIGFSGERGDSVHLGRCAVTIPRTHKIASDGSPWWHRQIFGDDRLRLAELDILEADQFWGGVRNAIAALSTNGGDAIVFVHGYNVSFEGAAIRAAQIGADLNLTASMAFFSWPSKGRLLGYPADEASIEASEDQIAAFLTDFIKNSRAHRIHLIAHSMGNRGLLRAIARIVATIEEGTGKPFGQVILAAPDVDSGVFRSGYKAYDKLAERTTLYVSRRDLAVRISEKLHAASRIGFAPPVAVMPGIDTINVTNADVTLLGHGYVGSSRSVLTDMHQLLSAGKAPKSRAMLEESRDGNEVYWQIRA